MKQKSPKAAWTGVIHIGSFDVDCRLFPLEMKTAPLPIKLVHAECKTVVSGENGAKDKKAASAPEAETEVVAEVTPVRLQTNCPKCQKPIRSDQVSRAIETSNGLVLITDEDFASLAFEPSKEAYASFAEEGDPALEAIGIHRRLLVCPKPAGLVTYTHVYHMLRISKRIGFIPELVINRSGMVAVIRAVVLPKAVFDEDLPAMVVDVLNDTEALRDPRSISDYPRTLKEPDHAWLASHIAAAQMHAQPLDPEKCVSPRRRKVKRLAMRVLRESMEK